MEAEVVAAGVVEVEVVAAGVVEVEVVAAGVVCWPDGSGATPAASFAVMSAISVFGSVGGDVSHAGGVLWPVVGASGSRLIPS